MEKDKLRRASPSGDKSDRGKAAKFGSKKKKTTGSKPKSEYYEAKEESKGSFDLVRPKSKILRHTAKETLSRLFKEVLVYLEDPENKQLQLLIVVPYDVRPEDMSPTVKMYFRTEKRSDAYPYLVKSCEDVLEVKAEAAYSGPHAITKTQRQWLVAEERILKSVYSDLKEEFCKEHKKPLLEWFQSPASAECIWKRHIQDLALKTAKAKSVESLKWEDYLYATCLETLKPCNELLMLSESGNPNGMMCFLSVSGFSGDEYKSQWVFPFEIKEEYSGISPSAIEDDLRKESKKFLQTKFKLDVEVKVERLSDVFEIISRNRPFCKEILILIERRPWNTDAIATAPGGKRRMGESTFECACREAKEEAGFDLDKSIRWKFWTSILQEDDDKGDKGCLYIMVDELPLGVVVHGRDT